MLDFFRWSSWGRGFSEAGERPPSCGLIQAVPTSTAIAHNGYREHHGNPV